MTQLAGQCHCGTVTVALETAFAAGELPLRACQCGFCRRHAALTTSDPEGRLVIEARPGSLARCRFGLRTAEFLICAGCGAYVGALAETDAGPVAVVNVRGMAMPGFDGREPEPMTYDHETAAERLARRKARWTPAAVIETNAI